MPLGVIPGLLLASVVYLTGSVYLDMLLFCLMTFAGVFVVALLFLLLVPEKGEQAVNIRFTRGGMEVRARGDLRYFSRTGSAAPGWPGSACGAGRGICNSLTAIENNAVLFELMGLR